MGEIWIKVRKVRTSLDEEGRDPGRIVPVYRPWKANELANDTSILCGNDPNRIEVLCVRFQGQRRKERSGEPMGLSAKDGEEITVDSRTVGRPMDTGCILHWHSQG